MALVTLDWQQQVDILNESELKDALREDAALRSVITGVKQEEVFYNGATVQVAGAGVPYFATPPNMVAAGLMWAVMNIGVELAAAQNLRVYKGGFPLGTTPVIGTGQLKMSAFTGSAQTPNLPFAKGQLPLRAGEQLTLIAGGSTILSVYICAISIPAERYGELLV